MTARSAQGDAVPPCAHSGSCLQAPFLHFAVLFSLQDGGSGTEGIKYSD